MATTHFMHPAHKLTQLTAATAYLCDGCKIPGTGTRFTCNLCNFNLHDYCANCPTRLTSTAQHPHPMSLVVYKPQPSQTHTPCQICLYPITGLAYQCKDCNFWVHPLCVSQNSGTSTTTSTSTSTSTRSGSGAAAAQRVGENFTTGLATNYIYDKLKEGSGDSAGDGEGFFDVIMSFFESSSS